MYHTYMMMSTQEISVEKMQKNVSEQKYISREKLEDFSMKKLISSSSITSVLISLSLSFLLL